MKKIKFKFPEERIKTVKLLFKRFKTNILLCRIRQHDNDNSINFNREQCINRIAVICDIEDEVDDNKFISNLERF